MKTSLIRKNMYWLAIAIVSTALIACGKKDSGSKNAVVAPQPVDPYGCAAGVNCVGMNAPTHLISASSSFSVVALAATFEMRIDILGDQAMGGMVNFQDPKAIVYYSGTAAATGQLQVVNANGVCGLVPGVYQINTVRPGQAMMATIGGIQLEAVGPARLLMTISNGLLYNSQDPNGTNKLSQTNRMGGTILIENINGQPCQGAVDMY